MKIFSLIFFKKYLIFIFGGGGLGVVDTGISYNFIIRFLEVLLFDEDLFYGLF